MEAEIVDDDGNRVPRSTNRITFRVEGPGRIVAVDNGSITSHESFASTQRHAHDGRAIAIVRATNPGTVRVVAASDGLVDGNLEIVATPPAPKQ